jgi:hypothetical protein
MKIVENEFFGGAHVVTQGKDSHKTAVGRDRVKPVKGEFT